MIPYKLRDFMYDIDINGSDIIMNNNEYIYEDLDMMAYILSTNDYGHYCHYSKWYILGRNSSDSAINIIHKIIDKLFKSKRNKLLKGLCTNTNPKAIEIISKNINLLTPEHWVLLCKYNFDNASKFILQNLDNMNICSWIYLCQNENCFDLIKNNLNNIPLLITPLTTHFIDNERCYKNIPDEDLILLREISNIKSNYIGELELEYWNRLCLNQTRILELFDNYENINEIVKNKWILLCALPNEEILNIILSEHSNKFNIVNYESLCLNPHDKAIEFIENRLNKLNDRCWNNLCYNHNSKAIELVYNNLNKINNLGYYNLCINKSLNHNDKIIQILKENITKLDNYTFDILVNRLDYAKLFDIISNNLDELMKKIHLCVFWHKFDIINNYDYIKNLLEKPDGKYKLYSLWSNPNIYTYDYELMKNNRDKMINKTELINVRMSKKLYYENIYNYDIVLDEYN